MEVPYEITSSSHRVFMKRIRERRLELGLTQADVAERLGISAPSYASIEGGKASPTLDQVEKVAKALKTKVIELLSEEPVPSR